MPETTLESQVAREAAKPDNRARARNGSAVAQPDAEQKAGKKLPNIGESVHYVLHFGKVGQHRPMTVTSVSTPNMAAINGHVLLEPGDLIGENIHMAQNVPYSPDKLVGTWHYAEND